MSSWRIFLILGVISESSDVEESSWPNTLAA